MTRQNPVPVAKPPKPAAAEGEAGDDKEAKTEDDEPKRPTELALVPLFDMVNHEHCSNGEITSDYQVKSGIVCFNVLGFRLSEVSVSSLTLLDTIVDCVRTNLWCSLLVENSQPENK